MHFALRNIFVTSHPSSSMCLDQQVSNNFIRKQMKKKEGALIPITEWSQWFNNAKLQFCDLDVQSWDERALTELSQDELPPSLVRERAVSD